jgi:hypothetical protein
MGTRTIYSCILFEQTKAIINEVEKQGNSLKFPCFTEAHLTRLPVEEARKECYIASSNLKSVWQ